MCVCVCACLQTCGEQYVGSPSPLTNVVHMFRSTSGAPVARTMCWRGKEGCSHTTPGDEEDEQESENREGERQGETDREAGRELQGEGEEETGTERESKQPTTGVQSSGSFLDREYDGVGLSEELSNAPLVTES